MEYGTTLYKSMMYTHLFTVIPCIFLGAYLLFFRKGNALHRLLGKIYMSLMVITAIVSLFLPAMIGSRFLGHFGWIHLFSLLTLYSVPTALIAIKKGQVRKHQYKMISLYIGAILIAGGLTLAPGRFLHQVFFG